MKDNYLNFPTKTVSKLQFKMAAKGVFHQFFAPFQEWWPLFGPKHGFLGSLSI